jgi:hypothetical protein
MPLTIYDGFDAAPEMLARARGSDPQSSPYPMRSGDHADHHRIDEVARRELPHGS